MPEILQIESEPCLPGWRLMKGLSGYALDRNLHEAGWTSFQAGEINATVFGIDAQQMAHRAVEAILANSRAGRIFNSLEIARITSVGSERFPGVRFLTVAVNRRHIQEKLGSLFGTEDIRELGSSKNEWRPYQDAGLSRGNGLREETSRRPDLAVVSNSLVVGRRFFK